MYKYTPKKDGKGKIYSLSFLFLGFMIMIISSGLNFYTGIFQSISLIVLMIGIFVLVRYVLPFYTYVLDGPDFCVVRTMGTRETQLCNVSLHTAVGICKRPNSKKEKEEFIKKFGKTKKRFNFSASMGKYQYVLVLNFNGTLTEFYFDANDDFIKHFDKAIFDAKQIYTEEIFD